MCINRFARINIISLVSKAPNSLPILVHNVEQLIFSQISSQHVIKSRGSNRQFSFVLVMVPVLIHMLPVFANLGT